MGINTVVYIHKEDLNKLELYEFVELYQAFSGRWHFCIKERFIFDGDENTLSIKDILEHLACNQKVPQESRDLIRSFAKLRLIFRVDCIEEVYPDSNYVDLFDFAFKIWEKGKKEYFGGGKLRR